MGIFLPGSDSYLLQAFKKRFQEMGGVIFMSTARAGYVGERHADIFLV